MMRLFLIILSCVLGIQATLDSFICRKREDCQPNFCCSIGMERYSLPQCRPMGTKDDYCYVGAEEQDRILYYPSGLTIEAFNLYTMFCPCDIGYHCVQNQCKEE